MTKFNLREAIAKNKATFFTSINENEYYKDAEADDAEHIKALEKDMKDDKMSSKMKMSELKAKIKEMVLAEMNLDIQDTTKEYDFLSEKKEDEEETEEDIDIEDTDIEGIEDMDIETSTEVDPNVKAVQDLLTQAQAAAQTLGDEKLTDQIGNTITFFTRAHIVDKGAISENETTNLNDYSTPVMGEHFLEILGYEDYPTFFFDNPGAFENLVDWAMKRKQFAQKLIDSDMF
jgi:hypothetical protein